MKATALGRTAAHIVSPFIVDRWSPRAMSGEGISQDELMSLFEAARWAPSSYNGQPWRFIYARRDTPQWSGLFDLMVEFNQGWAKNAAVLMVVISRKTFDFNGKPARTHNFDAGSAWMSLAFEAASRGLIAHGMEGFDYDKARSTLNIPEGYDIEAMVAVGKPGKKEELPKELQEKELPSDRKPVEQFIMEGAFRE